MVDMRAQDAIVLVLSGLVLYPALLWADPPANATPTQPAASSAQASDASPTPEAAAAPAASETPALISVDFKDADIRQVLRVISLKSAVDIVAGPDVEGTVTIKLTNVPWE